MTLQPKEKANNLVNRYRFLAKEDMGGKSNISNAKKSAIICCNEIIETIEKMPGNFTIPHLNYWNDVISEIEKM